MDRVPPIRDQDSANRNLRINPFRLWMQTVSNYTLARILITKAIKLGATDLTLRVRRSSPTGVQFVLPNEVLESETLTRLSAHECAIDLLRFRNEEVILYSLKSLSLFHAFTFGGDLFFDLISRCPFIEKITLDCTVSLRLFEEQRRLCPSCELIGFDKLKSLQLIGLDSNDSIYRHVLWPKFPRLKELMICCFNSDYDWNGLTIRSQSLKIITLNMHHSKITNGKFDVPNIRKFKVVGVHLPRLDEFKTSSTNTGWESDIQIHCDQLTVSWFSNLCKLLRALSSS